MSTKPGLFASWPVVWLVMGCSFAVYVAIGVGLWLWLA